ncbi:MAG: hypothetical protein RL757_3098 [Bacteroidota bacterium]|jgi:phosphopantothenoylcysteine decarboxylase/phosphopantothenate--cysteine ligase
MKGKRIIIGVSGSIAAYKTAILVRLFVKAGAEVQVLMTDAAKQFITPLTLSTLSKRPVFSHVVGEEGWNNHVELGLWADAFVVAPCTATTLAKLANGICDNMLAATYLSARCPVFVAPAMDLDMWTHGATRRNLELMESYGATVIPVGHGELASGLVGDGRMAEPQEIFDFLNTFFNKRIVEKSVLQNKKILITAGPTHEPIDPVRFIGNRSSGKMGLAIAQSLAIQGARVKIVLGPAPLTAERRAELEKLGIEIVRVETAQQMFEATTTHFSDCDAAILAAAVADYRPKNAATSKIKKTDASLQIELESTPDIAKYLGENKKSNQILVGFALETDNELEHAKGKLKRKNLDFIVLNSLRDTGAGFAGDTNKISIIFDSNYEQNVKIYDLKNKTAVADDIVAELSWVFSKKEN